MKLLKRNAIILTVLLFVCVAVYLNWRYSKDEPAAVNVETTDPMAQTGDLMEQEQPVSEGDAGLFYEAEPSGASAIDTEEYFASARLTRQQARDSAISALQEAATIETASQEAIDQTMDEIAVMAEYSVSEAEIETMIKAKGFEECVVFLNGESATVAVTAPTEGLSVSAVSRITDIVVEQTGLTPEQITIIEVK